MIKFSFCDSVVIMRHWEVTIGSSLKVGKVGNVNFFPFEVQCFVNQINKDWRSKKKSVFDGNAISAGRQSKNSKIRLRISFLLKFWQLELTWSDPERQVEYKTQTFLYPPNRIFKHFARTILFSCLF